MAVNVQPRTIHLLAFALAGLTLTTSCGPVIKTAPFRATPNTVRRGDLLGPFTGKVSDADSLAPLKGVTIWCSWAFVEDVGDPLPHSSVTKTAVTGADGSYHIPVLAEFPTGFKIRLARFSLVAYRKGYVAYRHDRIFGHRARRTDFAQRFNQIKLVRWSPEQSHAQHLMFLGGGPTRRKASDWERALAAQQLDAAQSSSEKTKQPAQGTATSRPANLETKQVAAVLLSADDVRAISGYRGRFSGGPLPGRTDATSTFHLRAENASERYDVAVRLWRLEGPAATALYEKMLNALAESRQKDELADRNFIGERGEIRVLGLLDGTHSSVVLLTCGKGQCPTEEKLLVLGRKLEANLAKLPTRQMVVDPTEGVKP